MKIPKIDTTLKKKGGIEYPHVSAWDVVKEYWMDAKLYWWAGAIVLVGTSITTIIDALITPTFYKRFFDELQGAGNPQDFDATILFSIIFSIFLLHLVSWASSRAYWFALSYFEASVMRDARQRAFDYTINHAFSFFSNNFTGSLVQRINRYTRSFERVFDRICMDILPLVIKAVGSIIILYVVLPTIAYIMLGWVVLFLAISFFLNRFKLKYDVYGAEIDSRATGAMSDSISNHNTIQTFTGSSHESKLFDVINRQSLGMNLFRWRFGNMIDAIQGLLVITVEFLIFYYGIKHWQLGSLTLGSFVLIQAYIITLSTSLWGFGRIIRDIFEGFADAKEMVEILHLGHEVQDVRNPKELKVPEGRIEFKNVGFKFGKINEGKQVFDNINISIKPGEKVALIGSSGAGKSTLTKLLMRLYDIQSGEILIDGQNIKDMTQKSLRENISLVPQDPALFHRTLMENIRYGKRSATDEEVMWAAKFAHCDIFINEFPHKYETFVGERGVKLSGGERQRVAIARALLKNAPILVLDEATSSLDSHSEALIQDALHTLMEGKTTIVIAHRLSTIRKMDRIIVVSRGGVVEEGSHDELIKKNNGIYAKLWSLQAGGFENKSIEELLEV